MSELFVVNFLGRIVSFHLVVVDDSWLIAHCRVFIPFIVQSPASNLVLDVIFADDVDISGGDFLRWIYRSSHYHMLRYMNCFL